MAQETNPEEPTNQDVLELFRSLAVVHGEAQTRRQAYLESLDTMRQLCEDLTDVELKITGRLKGRGGTVVYSDNPKSIVDGLHIRVHRASVVVYEGQGDLITQHLPFIDIYGQTIETGESINAWLGVGKFGVEAEVIKSHSVPV